MKTFRSWTLTLGVFPAVFAGRAAESKEGSTPQAFGMSARCAARTASFVVAGCWSREAAGKCCGSLLARSCYRPVLGACDRAGCFGRHLLAKITATFDEDLNCFQHPFAAFLLIFLRENRSRRSAATDRDYLSLPFDRASSPRTQLKA